MTPVGEETYPAITLLLNRDHELEHPVTASQSN